MEKKKEKFNSHLTNKTFVKDKNVFPVNRLHRCVTFKMLRIARFGWNKIKSFTADENRFLFCFSVFLYNLSSVVVEVWVS